MKRFDAEKLLSDIVSKDRRTYLKAADTISDFDGETSVDEAVFINSLNSENEDIVFWSILALEHIGPRAASAIEKLIDLTKSEKLLYRMSSVKALSHVGPSNPEAIEAIFESFGDCDANVRREALQSCINLHELSEEQLAAIAGMAADPDEDVARWSEITQRNRRIDEAEKA